MLDLLITNGLLIDGSGSPVLRAQLAVKDGKIVKIARHIAENASQVIDAAGKVVTPGFIDSHSHSDRQFLTHPEQIEKVEQGITTSVAGQCGGSICGRDAAEFLKNAKNCAIGANMAMLIGHGTLRKAVMGTANRVPTEKELEEMKALLRSAMEHGALGVSFGMIYAPGCYAKTEELVEIAKVAEEFHGIAAIHLRNEGETLIEALQEFITVVRQSGVRGVVSHLKAAGLSANWGKVHTALALIEQANAEGLEIYADAYPYAASSTKFSSPVIPAAWRAEGVDALLARLEDPQQVSILKDIFYSKYPDLQWIMVVNCPGFPEYAGLRVPEIAALRGQDEFTAAIDIIRISKDMARGSFFSMCEADVKTVLAHPRVMIGTDAGVDVGGPSHPRLRGSFPRALGHYVRQQAITSLPEMIRKMTAMPAAVYGFQSKGLLREGFDADICIFDPDKIIDRADFCDSSLRAEGLDYVIVGGKIAAINAEFTGNLGGTMLYRNI